jgi:hypothetical protein
MDRLPPVLRALPGPAGADGTPRHPPVAAPACRSRRGSARSRRDAPALAHPAEPRPALACPPARPRAAPLRGRRRRRDDGAACAHRAVAARRPRREPARNGGRAALEAGGHGVVRVRGPHELRRCRDRIEGRARGRAARADRGDDRLGPRREHRPLQPCRGGGRAPGAGLRHRPRCRRAQLPPAAPGAARRHPPARDGPRQPESRPRLGGQGTASAARADRRRRDPRARARPPPGDLAQRATADAVRPVRLARAVGHRRVRAQGRPDGPPPPLDARGHLPGFEIVAERPIDESPRVLFLLRRR